MFCQKWTTRGDEAVSDQSDVQKEIKSGIQTITFHNERGNSLPGETLRRLRDVVDEAGKDTAVRVVVLQSRGEGAFCGGASFDELLSLKDPLEGKEFFMGFARLILSMRRCPKFIITRVQGKTVGGGVGVVAASDYVFAHSAAALRLSELALGIGPFVVGPAIERKVGVGAFQALALDTEWRDAAWAKIHGLYTDLSNDHQELITKVSTFAEKLQKQSPQAMAELKATFFRGTEEWEELLEKRAAISGRLVVGKEAQGIIAQLRK